MFVGPDGALASVRSHLDNAPLRSPRSILVLMSMRGWGFPGISDFPRCMLAFCPKAWDLFSPYRADFTREVATIAMDGLQDAQLVLAVHEVSCSHGGSWSDFRWKPCGSYSTCVRVAAVCFIVLTLCAQQASAASLPGLEALELPPWLAADLAAIPAICIPDAPRARTQRVLKASMTQAKQCREVDILMLHRLLQPLALQGEKSYQGIVHQYNASVFYDSSLMLPDRIAVRLWRISRPSCFSRELHHAIAALLEDVDSPAFCVGAMDHAEFFAGTTVSPTSHTVWSEFVTTTHESCLATLRLWCALHKRPSAAVDGYIALARRVALAVNIGSKVFKPRGVAQHVVDRQIGLVAQGVYDEDLDLILDGAGENAPESLVGVVSYLLDSSVFVRDTLAGTPIVEPPSGDAPDPSQDSVDPALSAEAFEQSLERDVKKFAELQSAVVVDVQRLAVLEVEHKQKLRDAMGPALAGFVDTYAPMLPFKASDKNLVQCLPKELEDRVAAVAGSAGCEASDVLRFAWFDLSSFAAPTAPDLAFVSDCARSIVGASGMAVYLLSDTPAGKGRALKKCPAPPAVGASGGAEPATSPGSGTGVAAASADAPPDPQALPPAPSLFSSYADERKVTSLLVADFSKMLKMAQALEGFFPQPVTFRYLSGKKGRALAIQPAQRAAWQGMRLLADWELNDIRDNDEFVDLGAGSSGKARQGVIDFKGKRSLCNKNSRFQRGVPLFRTLFADILQAARQLSREDGRRHPVLFVDMTCWAADSAAAHRA